jgi:ArsR family transcriptional regulator
MKWLWLGSMLGTDEKDEGSRMMDENQALGSFAAIAQETRLRIVRMLVVAGADGMAAGAITEKLGESTGSRVSFHLGQLEQAGLVGSRREGRSIIYSVIFSALSDLVAFLMHDCCQGHCKYCDRAIAQFAKCEGRPSE